MNNKKESGFTILYAVIISTVVLIVGVTLMNIISKQLIISTITKNSKASYSAAASGKDCVDYWYKIGHSKLAEYSSGSEKRSIVCAGEKIDLVNDDRLNSDPMIGINDNIYYLVGDRDSYTQYSKFSIDIGEQRACAVVYSENNKTTGDLSIFYKITGFNVPCDQVNKNNPRIVISEIVVSQ